MAGKERQQYAVVVIAVVLVLALAVLSFHYFPSWKNAFLGLATDGPQPAQEINVTDIWRKLNASSTNAQVTALAGDISAITISTQQVTRNWHGYVGHVSGDIVLDDSNNYSLYMWVLVDPRGEVYATRNDTSIDWTSGNIICADRTHIEREETEMNTNSEMAGGQQARDGVNETFNLTTHPSFLVSGNTFAANSCNFSTSLFVNDTSPNGPAPRSFNETLLWSTADGAFIFMSYVETDQYGFNNASYDFQMLVTEDGHGDDTSNTTYYFFLELE